MRHEHSALPEAVYHILLLNLLRIFPYVKCDADRIYLENAVEKLNQKLNTGGYEGEYADHTMCG